jgi:drug/metabolite transporter (DMT)-like permease
VPYWLTLLFCRPKADIDMPEKTSGFLELALLLLLGVLWGIPYALTKISLATIPPLTLVATRVAIAAVALWIIAFSQGMKIPTQRSLAGRLFVQGCIGCVIPYTLIAFGQQTVHSALAAILNSTGPLFVCLINLVWMRREPETFGRLIGVGIGLAGVILIAGASALLDLGRTTIGQLAIIAATFSSAVAVIHGRRFAAIPPEITAAGTLTWAALVLIPLCFLFESPLSSKPTPAAIVALLLNAIAATAIGFIVYFRLIRTLGSTSTASVGYLKPAVGVLIGCAFMGETLTWTAAIGLTAILLGVATIHHAGSDRNSLSSKIRPRII